MQSKRTRARRRRPVQRDNSSLVTLGCFVSEPLSARDAAAQRFAETYAKRLRSDGHAWNELSFRGSLAAYLRCRDLGYPSEKSHPINVNRAIAIAAGISVDELKIAS
jgi:hypothetical protein